jgi:protein phosphatase PTC7
MTAEEELLPSQTVLRPFPSLQETAAIRIQRLIRGHQVRKQVSCNSDKRVIWWKGKAKRVQVTGTWTFPPWGLYIDMEFLPEGGFFWLKGLTLHPGVHGFKFIVDGDWQCSPHYPVTKDSRGNFNNTLEIRERTDSPAVLVMALKILEVRRAAATMLQKHMRGFLIRSSLPFKRFRDTDRLLQWNTPAKSVLALGTFTKPAWGKYLKLKYCRALGGFVSAALLKQKLIQGSYHFKFVVDGVWKCSDLYPLVKDMRGNVNNCLLVTGAQRRFPRAISTRHLTHEAVSHDLAARESASPYISPVRVPRNWSGSFNSPLQKDFRDELEVPYSAVKLLFGGHMIAHPKARDAPLTPLGSADAYFVETEAQCFGLADGVGEWTTFGLDASLFPTELMLGCRHSLLYKLSSLPADSSEVIDEMVSALNDAEAQTSSFGSSTALLGLCKEGTLHVIYVGDSSFMVLRKRENGLATVYRSVEQQHCFNCPFQLARLPGSEHYSGLSARGLGSLVTLLQKSSSQRQDTALDARTEVIRLQAGDILIAGTDGLFDNLYDSDIVDIVRARMEMDYSDCCLPDIIARELAVKAVEKGWDSMYKSPFSRTSHKAGKQYLGGKLDDTTVVVGVAVPI